ncbi:MAG: MFS transporter [Chloroflexi bacterium]|nr:MFS transporter [Chloroflexota bacterium]
MTSPLLQILSRPLRWLLRLDQPVLPRSQADFDAEVAHNYGWNFTVNLVDGATFWFGASFISSATILPLFVRRLTDSPLAIGLLAVIAQAAWFLPQIFTANFMERLARKKPVVVNLGLFLERLPLWVMLLAAIVAGKSPPIALILLLGGYAWHGLGAGVVAISWQDLIARCFPVERRGRFMGLTMFIGAGSGVLGVGASTWLLRTFPFPTNFVYAFLVAAAFISISWCSLALTREPVQAVTAPRRSHREYLNSLPDLVRNDHNFRRFLIARTLMALGGLGSGFVTVAAVNRWNIPDATAGLFTAALLIGQTVGNLFFGFLADRYGHKLSLVLGLLANVLGFVIAWLAPAPEWYYAAFALFGITSGAVIVSGILIVLEFSDSERRPTYVGIANTGVGIVSVAAPLIGTGLATIGYGWVFVASALVSLTAFGLMRWWVREPRWNVEDGAADRNG